MKTKIYIFRNLIFTLFLIQMAVTANSQGTIQTPMGQTVYVVNNWDTAPLIATWESEAAQWIIDNQSDAQKKDQRPHIITVIPMPGMLLKGEVVQISG